MDSLPLIGGAYSARSLIASCTRAINLFPETNPKDSPVPTTHYQRPGLKPLSSPPQGGRGRNIWALSNGDGFALVGARLYFIDSAWGWHPLGDLSPAVSTPASMVDNGLDVMIVDGQPGMGWTFPLAGAPNYAGVTIAPIEDPAFLGATSVDVIDGFIIFNQLGTKNFQSTLANQVLPLDPLYIAAKNNYPDPLQYLHVVNHEIMLLGRLKTERWYDSGNAQFPFEEFPGTYIEHGTVAPYSVAQADKNLFWLSQDLQGIGMVLKVQGYQVERISNHALEVAIRKMYTQGTISDAIGSTYQQDGHLFYVLTFPSGNQTWVWDEAIADAERGWHQRAWTDPGSGALMRERPNGYASLYGKQVTIDWENGTIYELDLTQFYDEVDPGDGLGLRKGPVTCIRTFPHLMSGIDPRSGQVILANGKMVQHHRFMVNMDYGQLAADFDGGSEIGKPIVTMRYSDDRGHTYSGTIHLNAGAQGEFATFPDQQGLGVARDRVYEISYSYAGFGAVNGAWVEGEVLGQ